MIYGAKETKEGATGHSPVDILLINGRTIRAFLLYELAEVIIIHNINARLVQMISKTHIRAIRVPSVQGQRELEF